MTAPWIEKLISRFRADVYRPAGSAVFSSHEERNKEWRAREAQFRATCATLFAGVVQAAEPRGVVLLAGLNSYKQHALSVFALHALVKRGWAVACIDEAPYQPGRISDPDVAHFQQSLRSAEAVREFRYGDGPGLHFDWEVDWSRQLCRAEGLNLYGIIANRLGKEFRRYAVDIADPAVARRFETLRATCDAALALCLDAERRFGRRGLPVRFSGLEPNYPPVGVFKVYCRERGYAHGLEFVEVRQAYEKYFRAGRSGMVNAIEAQNVTRHRLYGASGLQRDKFEAWMQRVGDAPGVLAQAEGWVQQSRSGAKEPTAEGETVLQRVRLHRQNGGRVACLYGGIPFDFGHPWVDDGPAHTDMGDWYNHTVEALNGSDVLLLVKPHPGEADFRQYGRPNEFFTEMLRVVPADNVILLGHRWLNNADLLPYLDLGLTWRGTMSTELALTGVPVVMCGRYSMTEHVLDFPAPADRADYESMLRTPGRVPLDDDLKHRAGMIFEYYRNEIMIEYPFGWVGAKHNETGPPVLSGKAVERYLSMGHRSVDRMCEAFSE